MNEVKGGGSGMKWFLYTTKKGEIVRILAKNIPSYDTQTSSGTWIIHEWDRKQRAFVMPCCPEITYPVIRKQLLYLGELKI